MPTQGLPKSTTNKRSLGEWLNIDGISYIPSTVLLSGISKVSLKDNHLFAVLDTKGESPSVYQAELGFYLADTRCLSHWEMTVNGQQLVYLAHELRGEGGSCVFSMSNRDIPTLDGKGRIQRDTLLIRRILTLHRDCIFEQLEFTNYDVIDHELLIEQNMATNFDDIFEVRGVRRIQRGAVRQPVKTARGLVFEYEGLDKVVRRTCVEPVGLANREVELLDCGAAVRTKIVVPGKGRSDLKTIVSFGDFTDDRFLDDSFRAITVTEHVQAVEQAHRQAYLGDVKMSSNNIIFDNCVKNARLDIEMLTTFEAEQNLVYPYAGIPWFSAPFGRDGIITAYQTLPFFPNLASGVLDYVFKTIGTKFDDFTDAEPGKIFHEMRRGEMANMREIPYIPYYGSIDSTPLALILLGEYVSWTMDLEKPRRWWKEILMCLEWLDRWGDMDGDGFLEYIKKKPTGLDNQGWKDSHNSVMYANGALAIPPIQLCEVQAYAYRARRSVAKIARLVGEHGLASQLEEKAASLKKIFYQHFWDRDERYVYLARDGHKQPCNVMSSNQGHCLWGQILDPRDGESVAAHLMSPRLFSGYGIRTLAADEKGFNPLSYHNGSVWPHDNSLIAEGLRFYNQTRHLQKLVDALFDVAATSEDFRLPELFCGFRRRGNEPPVPYEVACRPQAWAAGSVFLILKSALGLVMEIEQQDIILQSPILPSKVEELEIKGIRVRDTEFSVVVRRGNNTSHVEITERHGSRRILVQK